ncbi:MAG: hypothetical protein WBA12_14685 [Catalinimonas sp.]
MLKNTFLLVLLLLAGSVFAEGGDAKISKPERFEVSVEALENQPRRIVRVLVVNNQEAPVKVVVTSPNGEVLLRDKVADLAQFTRNYVLDEAQTGTYTFRISNGAYEVTRRIEVR